MSSHYKFFDGLNEAVPAAARYSFPTQANRTWKQTVKIPPVNGSTFANTTYNQPIRFNLPANGYLNTANSFLTFDCQINASTAENLRIQNNIQSIFKRIRLVYGSLPLEDIRESHALVRLLTDGGSTGFNTNNDWQGITDGVGGLVTTYNDAGDTLIQCNARSYAVQVHSPAIGAAGTLVTPAGTVSNATTAGTLSGPSRRYTVQLPFGLFLQNKLIPLKFMASSLYFELEMASNSKEFMCAVAWADNANTGVTLSNMAYSAEILDFDGSYDAAFLEGLRGDGVPLKFATWDTFLYGTGASATQQFLIPERNRSIKAGFCVQIGAPGYGTVDGGGEAIDSHAFLQSSTGISSGTVAIGSAGAMLNNFQWRVGSKYYPAQPVLLNQNSSITNGAAEAYVEFAKAINTTGDYRLPTSVIPQRWCQTSGDTTGLVLNHRYDWAGREAYTATNLKNIRNGPCFFVVASDFEASDGTEVSGINGEEQNDIALTLNYSSAQDASASYLVFIYYDAMIILKEGNEVELIK